MKFSKSLLDEIKNKIEISDVVGKRVVLQKRGKEFVGLSPFQNEKTPSFTVNNEKQFYHCFSSNKHGDIFTFLVDVEGLSFPQAVEKLAEQAGVELRELTKDEERKISVEDSFIPCSIVIFKLRESEYLISMMPASGSVSMISIEEASK